MAGLLEGEGMKKALRWLSERRQEAPAEPRARLIDEAGRRFDLTPVEVEFLLQRWREDGPPTP
jgi:hypothetical protein